MYILDELQGKATYFHAQGKQLPATFGLGLAAVQVHSHTMVMGQVGTISLELLCLYYQTALYSQFHN